MEPGWLLWSGTIGLESPIASRIEAARACGYARVSLSALDVFRAEESGVPARDVGRMFADNGLDIVMDPIMNWYDGEAPAGSRFARFTCDEALRMCSDVGAVSATAIGQGSSELPVERIAESFAVLCDRASDIGMDIHLEFTALHAINSLRMAWDIVRLADRSNGGIVFDTWHFFRTDPDFALLETIPGERIMCVQVDDGAAEVVGTMRDDTLNRLLPGDGTFDLVRAIACLDRIGGLTWVGPEVISPTLAAMDPVAAARLAKTRIQELIVEARGT